MKLQYRYAGIMVSFGAVFLIPIIVFISFRDYNLVLQKELKTLGSIAVSSAEHMNSHIKENGYLAEMIAGTPELHKALIDSNASFSAMTETVRKQRIEQLNRKWMETKDINDPFIQQHLTNPIANYLRSQQHKLPGRFGEIFLTNRHGVMIASTGKLTTLAHAHKYWWKASYHEGKGKVFFDDRGFDTSVEGYVLGAVVPVRNGARIIGILKCNVNIMGPLTDVIQDRAGQEDIEIVISRTKGLIVAQEGKTPLSNQLPASILERVQRSKSGAYIDEIEEQLVGFATINSTHNQLDVGFGGTQESIDHQQGNLGEGWHLLVIKEKSEVLKESLLSLRYLITICLVFIITAAAVSLVLGRLVSRPIAKLSDHARKLGEGDLSVRVQNYRNDEVGVLSKTFNDMAENLEKTLTSRDNLIAEIELRIDTEKKLQSSLDEKETLLREIHHRVKNNMAVISSLLELQKKEIDDKKTKETLQDSQNRIKTMSMVHQALYQSASLASINMKDYLPNLTRTILQGYQARQQIDLDFHIDDVFLTTDQASPLGLITNELFTNSLKHAFPDGQKGTVAIELKKVNEASVMLTYHDNGIGMNKNSENSSSLGLKLINSLAKNQLNGTLQISNATGTTFTITFDMESA